MADNKNYSKIIAGTMTWGRWGKQFEKEEISELIKHCFDSGITTFDHADIYGDYTTEKDFGNGFSLTNIDREKVQFISKCGIQFTTKNRPVDVKHYDYSKKHIISSVEQSLKNLQTEYLDMLLLHRPSPLLNPFEVAEAITKLKDEGKIKEFGVSNFTPSQIAVLESALPVQSNQVEFSLTSYELMYEGTIDDCMAKQRMAMSWSPLGSYFKIKNDQIKRIQKVLEPMSEKYNVSTDQLLLAWVLKHPANVHPVIGTTLKDRISLSLEAMNINLKLQDWFILLQASRGHEIA